MIKNGRPYTCEDGGLGFMFKKLYDITVKPDDELITDLSVEYQDKARQWVELFVSPRKTVNKKFTSYSIKHWIERYIGHYITNNQAKDIMMRCGYEPVDPDKLNWYYKVNIKESGKLGPLKNGNIGSRF